MKKTLTPVEVLAALPLGEQLEILKEIGEIGKNDCIGKNILAAARKIEAEIKLGTNASFWFDTIEKKIPLLLAQKFAQGILIHASDRICTEQDFDNLIERKQQEAKNLQKDIEQLQHEKMMLRSIPLNEDYVLAIIKQDTEDRSWEIRYVGGQTSRFALSGTKTYKKDINYPFHYENEKEAIDWLKNNLPEVKKRDI